MKTKPIDITCKAIRVIESCTSLKHIQMMDDYVDLACKRILRRGTPKNFEYATKVRTTAHYKFIGMLKMIAIKNEMEK